MYNYTYFRHHFIMNEVTVIELSKQTGLSRSQIYYLISKDKLIISKGKINLKEALQVITSLKIKKTKITNEENFRQILNMLNLQNITLQKQLDLAYEREKNHLAELASHRQNLPLKPAPTPPINENDSQVVLENNLDDTNENSRNLMQFENENHTPTESCEGINKETKSTIETSPHPLPIASFQNEIILFKSDNGEVEPSGQKNEVIEQEDNTLDTQSPPKDDNKQLKAPYKRKTAMKFLPAKIKLNLNSNKQSGQASRNKSMTDHDEFSEKDHHG